VEQSAATRLEGTRPAAKVDGGSTTETEGDHLAGLKEECRPGNNWVERPLPLKAHIEPSSNSPPPYEHDKHPPG
jgi:hypothetical protein